MPRFTMNSEPTVKYRNCYVITVEGYWGDGDENYLEVETFPIEREDKALAFVHMFKRLEVNNASVDSHGCIETSKQMEEWITSQGYDQYRFNIPVDSACYEMVLSTIEDITIEYYTNKGLMHVVHYED